MEALTPLRIKVPARISKRNINYWTRTDGGNEISIKNLDTSPSPMAFQNSESEGLTPGIRRLEIVEEEDEFRVWGRNRLKNAQSQAFLSPTLLAVKR